MTKKDYIAIAAILADHRMVMDTTEDWIGLMEAFIVILKSDNPRFDEARFKEACYK